jgi:anti-sigma factor RsiW
MNHSNSNTCDEILLDRYLDGDLGSAEKAQMAVHLGECRQCRLHVETMTDFLQAFRGRVQQVTDAVDYVGLEKQVLNKALWPHRSRSVFSRVIASLKYAIPATVMAGGLLFFAYSNTVVKPVSAPSAVINSFTGAMSSVMIFETPETRQTILWYHEGPDLESERNAV